MPNLFVSGKIAIPKLGSLLFYLFNCLYRIQQTKPLTVFVQNAIFLAISNNWEPNFNIAIDPDTKESGEIQVSWSNIYYNEANTYFLPHCILPKIKLTNEQ